MYGGRSVNTDLATVEILSLDGQTWHFLPTPMFAADSNFASVSLPDVLPVTTSTKAYIEIGLRQCPSFLVGGRLLRAVAPKDSTSTGKNFSK